MYINYNNTECNTATYTPASLDEEYQPILKATKCDFCVEQTSGPACLNACPHDALSRTDLTQATSLTKWLKKK